ncbi:hypothetical protein PROFUN_13086 [Planoprotostelium fungivorum]|uniref:GH16 domain-containing protein n=1 Tax=Planoprotostelium fungivorum TaxID=1890364 RepID=A0A2P6N5G8_9EUKA|nr:hypothetical protein PROFUN_13086 [Planoprotostelium fungivorum]
MMAGTTWLLLLCILCVASQILPFGNDRLWQSPHPSSSDSISRWEPKRVQVDDSGRLTLTIDQNGYPENCEGSKKQSTEISSSASYGYGYFEATFASACNDGTVSTISSRSEITGGSSISIMLDDECNQVSYSHRVDTRAYSWGHFPLPFGSSKGQHSYGFLWTPQFISWFVDRQLHFTTANISTPLVVPSSSMHLILSHSSSSQSSDKEMITTQFTSAAYYPLSNLPRELAGSSNDTDTERRAVDSVTSSEVKLTTMGRSWGIAAAILLFCFLLY